MNIIPTHIGGMCGSLCSVPLSGSVRGSGVFVTEIPILDAFRYHLIHAHNMARAGRDQPSTILYAQS